MSDQAGTRAAPGTGGDGDGDGSTPERLTDRAKRDVVEFVKFIAGAFVVYLAITTIVFRTFFIPSSSMEPTLEVGDRVLVLNFAYGYSRHTLPFGVGDLLPDGDGRLFGLGPTPKRGHIVVFRHPRTGDHLIKRVIARPGDTVALRSGRLFVNDVAFEREYVRDVRYRDYTSRPGVVSPADRIDAPYDRTNRLYCDPPNIVRAQLFLETIPGYGDHRVYDRADACELDRDRTWVVPSDHVFVMGDNRDASNDSRGGDLSFVPTENLVGRAMTVLFTFERCAKEAGLECPSGRVWRPF